MAVHSSWLYYQSGYFVHKVHCADGLLVYLLAVPYAQSAHCILRLQKSLRSVKVTPSSGLSFLANAWHNCCRGVFWTEWSPFSVVDCSLATPFDRSVRLYSIDPIVRHNHYHIYIYMYISHNIYHNLKPWIPWSWTSQQHWHSTASSAKRRAMITAIRPSRGSHVKDGLAHHSLRPHL